MTLEIVSSEVCRHEIRRNSAISPSRSDCFIPEKKKDPTIVDTGYEVRRRPSAVFNVLNWALDPLMTLFQLQWLRNHV
jgi:hypothetical protein